MFRCCSLETSRPHLLPQSPKVCPIHLCLFFCFETEIKSPCTVKQMKNSLLYSFAVVTSFWLLWNNEYIFFPWTSLCLLKEKISPSCIHKITDASSLSVNEAISQSVQFSSVTQSCPTLCDYMNRSRGLPVHHQLPEITQTHVHWVGDAIQPSHPLSSPSSPAPNPS